MGRSNFGLRNRDMGRAGMNALKNAASQGACSYSTVATNGDRWGQFADWLKEEASIRWMEDIRRDHVLEYGRELAEKVEAGDLAAATAQNAISAINSVMDLATKGDWDRLSPTKDCGIGAIDTVRHHAPEALDRDRYESTRDDLLNSGMERQAAAADLARDFGLRSKEASLLDARRALNEAQAKGRITISAGTKGGRVRTIPARNPQQMATLERAAQVQGDGRSIMPASVNWKEWRDGGLRDGREVLKEHLGGGYHDLRSAYACERYKEITGEDARVAGGPVLDKVIDDAARAEITEELGHGRLNVLSAYIGGRT